MSLRKGQQIAVGEGILEWALADFPRKAHSLFLASTFLPRPCCNRNHATVFSLENRLASGDWHTRFVRYAVCFSNTSQSQVGLNLVSVQQFSLDTNKPV